MQIMLQHKEVALLCKKRMTPTKAQSALLIPQINKTITTPKPHMEPKTTSKHCINYGRCRNPRCRNPSLGLTTKVRGCKVVG